MENKNYGLAGAAAMNAANPAMKRAMPAFQDKRESAEKPERDRLFFEDNKEFHENRLARLSNKGGRPLC